jgi:hypothetical protein
MDSELDAAAMPTVLREGLSSVLEVRLVHAEPGRRVVEASAWRDGSCLGRCLGEAADAEAAEDRAIQRLQQRLTTAQPGELQAGAATPRPAVPAPVRRSPAAVPHRAAPSPQEQDLRHRNGEPESSSPAAQALLFSTEPERSVPAAPPPAPAPAVAGQKEEAQPDPDDWSDELAELDVQLKRLAWDRSQESIYLQRAFGHPSRNRLTTYADLLAYLRALRGLHNGSDPGQAPIPLRRRDLLSQCDQLLTSLRWDASQGRQLLEGHFQLASRQQLSDEQLLQFNMLLEEQLISAGSAAATAASPG